MNSLLQLVNFKPKKSHSYSILLDFQQIHVRNAILFCTGLSMFRFLTGDNIICQNVEKSLSQDYIDTLCFINGTMTMGDPIIYHDYYQWVPVYLLLLALAFYFPYSIWLKFNATYIQQLENLKDKSEEKVQVIKESNGNWMYFKTWALEVFYAVYLFFILYLTNIFFNSLWSRSEWSWKAINEIFPDHGTCFIVYHHSSGSSDGKFSCLLPLCSVYRKIFMFLYGLILFVIMLNLWIIINRIITLVYKYGYVNVWWAFKIVETSAVTWNAKRELNVAFKKMMLERTGNETEMSEWTV